MKQLHSVQILFLLIFILGLSPARAADRYWVGGSGGAWLTAGNWSATAGGAGGAGTPGSVDNAIFTGFSGTVSFDAANITVNSLQILNGAVTINRPASATSLNVNDGGAPGNDFYIASGATLTLSSTGAWNFTVVLAGSNPTGLIDGTLELTNGLAGATASSGGRVDATITAGNQLTVSSTGIINLRAGGTGLVGNRWKFDAGAQYNIYRNGTVVPDGNYDPASVITFYGLPTGSTTSSATFSGFPTTIGTYVINLTNPTQTLNSSFGSNALIKGDLKILNTGAFYFRPATSPNNVTVMGNVEVAATGKLQIANSGVASSFNINGNLMLNGELDQQAGSGANTLTLLGNFVQGATGILTESGSGVTSELVFKGTAKQSLTQNGTITNAMRFQINNPAGVKALTDWTIPSPAGARLLLTSGNVDMNGFKLSILNPATVSLVGGTVPSHIIGRLARAANTANAAYLFPVSKSDGEVASVKLYPVSGTATTFEVEYFVPNPFDRLAQTDATVKNAGNYYWDIARASGTDNAAVAIMYGSNNFNPGNANPEADLRLLHWNGAAWDNLGGSGAAGEIEVANVSTFSPFSLGTVGAIPLPVRDLRLSAHKEGSANRLQWSTAGEQNNRGFYVERSTDGRNFTSLGFVASAATGGTGTAALSYAYTDHAAPAGDAWYRLRQEDINGRSTQSATVLVRSSKAGALTLLAVYPNPVASTLHIQLASPSPQTLRLQVSDALGKTVLQASKVVDAGSNAVALSMGALPAGQYLLTVVSADGRQRLQQKLVKN